MKAKALRRILKLKACVEPSQKGSHLRVECGICATTIPVRAGEISALVSCEASSAIFERCLGPGWLKKS